MRRTKRLCYLLQAYLLQAYLLPLEQLNNIVLTH